MRLLTFLLLATLLAAPAARAGDDGFPAPSAEFAAGAPGPGDEGGGLIIPEGYTPPPENIPIDEPAEGDEAPPPAPDPGAGGDPGGDPGGSVYEPPVIPVEDTPFDTPGGPATPPAPAGDPAGRPGRISEDEPPVPAAPPQGDDGFGMEIGDPAPPGGRINDPSPPAAATGEVPLRSAAPEATAEDEFTAPPANPEAERLFEEGTRRFNAKDYKGAAESFRRAVALDQGNDVYKLALEMVESTLAAQEPAATAPTAEVAVGGPPAPEGTPTDVLKLGDRLPEKRPPAPPAEKPKPGPVRTASGSLAFERGAPVGDLKFWKGRGATVDGDTAVLPAGKAASDFAVGFRIPGRPVKALAILTHATSGGAKFFHPLRVTLNKAELLDGTYQLKRSFADHVFNLTAKAKQGINVLRFSQKTKDADYLLRKITIFVQYE